MYTLRHASEVRAMNAIDELKTVPAKIKPDEVKLARQVISNFETGGDLTQYQDDYQQELRKLIDAKIAGEEIVEPKEEEPPKVVNLMEALRQSLDRVSSNKKKTAKIGNGKTVRMAAAGGQKKRAARG
jgi:DNA end-binding protein Ku